MSLREEPPYSLRAYKPSDFLFLCEIDRLCFSEAISYTPEEIAFGLAQPGAFAIVAEAAEKPIAFVLAYRTRRKLGHIVTIDVLAEYRWMGIGKKLMNSTEENLQEKGVTRILLEVSVSNGPAIRFYEGLRYVKKRDLPGYYPDGSDAFLMEKAW